MISGSFHPIAQEWRYYSREKSLIHTLHVAELPNSVAGDTIEIAATSPATNNGPGEGGHFSVPPLNLGGAPSRTISVNISQQALPDCFASTYNKTILAQKNVDIAFMDWSVSKREVYFTVKKSGWYVLGVQGHTDQHDLTYQGPAGDGKAVVQINRFPLLPSNVLNQANFGVFMDGLPADPDYWNAGHYCSLRGGGHCHAFSPAGEKQIFSLIGAGLGSLTDGSFSAWIFKIAEL